tara:strand:+ start:899 stop:1288 length:390 start_codon:yes stop_codon:yes gene_type:complete
MTETDPPQVSLESLRVLPGTQGAPRFEIKLRIANPNTQALDIVGISYSIALLDRKLISGVTNEIPRIEGYSEEIITLEAGLQLIELLRLLASLGASSSEPINYDFSAKIDFNGLMPTQRLKESGEIRLN